MSANVSASQLAEFAVSRSSGRTILGMIDSRAGLKKIEIDVTAKISG